MRVIGRCERGRGDGNPGATFASVIQIRREHRLPTWQLRGLMERSSLALFEYGPPHGIVTTRDDALSAARSAPTAQQPIILWMARQNSGHLEGST